MFFKNYCETSNQKPQICLLAEFCEQRKLPQAGPKNVLFWYFWA